MNALLGALGAYLLFAGPSVGAVPQVRTASTDQAHQLARHLNSGDRVEDILVFVTSAMPRIMANSPEWKRLVEARLDRASDIMRAIRPVVLESITNELPSLSDRIAAVYGRNLTPDESGRLLAAYSSPANVKFNRAMMRRLDLLRLVDARGEFDRGRAATMTAQAYPAALATLTPAERAQVVEFRTSPLAAKFAGLHGQVAAARAAWMEEVAPALDAAVVRALPAASDPDL